MSEPPSDVSGRGSAHIEKAFRQCAVEHNVSGKEKERNRQKRNGVECTVEPLGKHGNGNIHEPDTDGGTDSERYGDGHAADEANGQDYKSDGDRTHCAPLCLSVKERIKLVSVMKAARKELIGMINQTTHCGKGNPTAVNAIL